MSEIKLRADEAREMAGHVKKEASEAQSQVEDLRRHLNGLSDSFTGQAATAFDATFDEWKAGAVQMLDGLDGLGEFLTQAANTIENADAEIASQLG